jgi:voltage-gated potassium channel
MDFKRNQIFFIDLRKKLSLSVFLIFLIISFGTVGYMLIERWSFLDSLYMTIITLSSVGFKEVHEVSTYGRIFTVFLIIGGVGTVVYALNAGAKIIIEGELREAFGRRKLEKVINALKDHYIICGYGRMGKIICKELNEAGKEFVVIEREIDPLEIKEDFLIYKGDATSDETLREVGIEKAKGLITVLPTDAENLYVVLSARGLNPRLFIVARASDEGAEQKLLRAGADEVVSPYNIGGLRIAHKVLKPVVVDFIEFATKSSNLDIQLEEIVIQESSELAGLSLDECGIGRDLGIIIVAIKQSDGTMQFNPTFRSTINAGDTLIVIGEVSRLRVLEDKAMRKSA